LALLKPPLRFFAKFVTSTSATLRVSMVSFHSFLSEMVKAKIAPENNNRFVFWRLVGEVVGEVGEDEER
jgi:hypothetical protein